MYVKFIISRAVLPVALSTIVFPRAAARADIVYGDLQLGEFTGRLDLDLDGSDEFMIWTGFGDCMSGCTLHIFALEPENEVLLEPGSTWAGALDWDEPIDASATYGAFGAMAHLGPPTWCLGGPWCQDTSTRFLGVRFTIGGATHYGWIRTQTSTLLVFDYAYEDVADTPIIAGAGFPCAPDVNGDGVIALEDLVILLGHFGAGPAPPQDHASGDIDADHDVDLNDLVELLAAFGRECD